MRLFFAFIHAKSSGWVMNVCKTFGRSSESDARVLAKKVSDL
jgi:hypothetical protein